MKRILVVFGTRPEAIKMAPLIHRLAKEPGIQLKVCVTAQHREMLDQVLTFFEIEPHYDLNLMKAGQGLYQLTAAILTHMQEVIEDYKPTLVLVHGDTTTAVITALAAFYGRVQIGHVEAGLRTHNKAAPFPEEMNRQLTGRLADMHFAPTAHARQNLLNEGISPGAILVTGNTVIDALHLAQERLQAYEDDDIRMLREKMKPGKKTLLITAHRRENFGAGFKRICEALKTIAEDPSVQLFFPVHLNPEVQQIVHHALSGLQNVHLIPPLSYPAFTWLMLRSYLILTDSGGIQEEAPALGKPVLVFRDTSERPEAIDAGGVLLVGTHTRQIIDQANRLLSDQEAYNSMAQKRHPYGDGQASRHIIRYIQDQSRQT